MHVLFLCTGNSCRSRSQMAEGWMRQLASDLAPDLDIEASSAGLEAHGLDPRAVSCMQRYGIDISMHTSDILDSDMIAQADLVITVCSHADANCPVVPVNKERRHIPFDDPARATGSEEEVEACFSRVCLEIRDALQEVVVEFEVAEANSQGLLTLIE